MCGIAGLYLKDPSIVDSQNDRIQFDRFVDALFLGIEPRGRDATGFVAMNGSVITMDKDDKRASDFIKTRKRAWMDGGTRAVIAHTRLATQGDPEFNQNNHPVLFGTTFITHNGHINNDDEVFEKLKLERGNTEVDSVAIAATLEKHGFDNLPEALKLLRGGYAVAAINPKARPDELLLIKGPTSPLYYFETKHMLVWASTGSTIRDAIKSIDGFEPAWKDVLSLSEGDVIHVKDGKIDLMEKHFTPQVKHYSSWSSAGYTGTVVGNKPRVTTGRTGVIRTILNLIEPIKEKEKKGQTKAITYAKKDLMSDGQRKNHNGIFKTCLHCQRMIAEMHIMDNATWGEICVDCLSHALSATKKLPEAKPTVQDPVEWAKMSQDDYDFLEEYAEFEYDIMEETLEALQQRTGMSRAMIWYMVYASDDSNFDTAIDAFRDRIQEEYLDMEKSIMQGSFREPPPHAVEEIEEVDACEIPIPPARQIEAPKGLLGKCDHCRRKAKVMIDSFRWCNAHADKCFGKGCKEPIVAYDAEGKRWCHAHARGVKKLTQIRKEILA